jgi:quinolinate synthase
MKLSEIQREIIKLKKEKNALLLVHNYQIPEIQVIADYMGDSLGLCRKAQKAKDKEIIVFCGVDFMAETAAILNPDKKVVLPSHLACCPMAGMLPTSKLKKVKENHPDVPVVLYVNTLAEAKAEATVTCTSANAAEIVRKLDSEEVIFGPDKNLAYYVSKQLPGVSLIVVPEEGHCSVHRFLGKGEEALELKKMYPEAELWVHPECEPEFQDIADFIMSTGGMVRRANKSDAKTFIVGTENGLIERLKREHPEKTFLPVKEDTICAAMKRINLDNLYLSLQNEEPEIKIDEDIASRARESIELMLELSS